MTRLGRASALLPVFAGDYAILMLINGQLTDFDVSEGSHETGKVLISKGIRHVRTALRSHGQRRFATPA